MLRALHRRCSLPKQLFSRFSSSHQSSLPPTDSLGLPINPSWSVHDLINSYPSPKLSEETLTRLHHLAALIPPKKDSLEFSELKKEMEDLIKLVEAVRSAPTAPAIESCGHVESSKKMAGWQEEGPPDGRIWPNGWGMNLEENGDNMAAVEDLPVGRELLKEAKRTKDGFYVVDSTKKKT